MIKIQKITGFLIIISGTTNYGMDTFQRVVMSPFTAAKGIATTGRQVVNALLYEPFWVTFKIKMSQGNKEEFLVGIVFEASKSPVVDNESELSAIANQLFVGHTFTYEAKKRPQYIDIINTMGLTSDEKVYIKEAMLAFEKKLSEQYMDDIDFKNATTLTVRIGTNSALSRCVTNLYNIIADFSSIVGIMMPRIEKEWIPSITNKWLFSSLMLVGGAYLAYRYWDQIPSLTQIGSKIEFTGEKIKEVGAWCKTVPIEKINIPIEKTKEIGDKIKEMDMWYNTTPAKLPTDIPPVEATVTIPPVATE